MPSLTQILFQKELSSDFHRTQAFPSICSRKMYFTLTIFFSCVYTLIIYGDMTSLLPVLFHLNFNI